jgi:hypothetical protein
MATPQEVALAAHGARHRAVVGGQAGSLAVALAEVGIGVAGAVLAAERGPRTGAIALAAGGAGQAVIAGYGLDVERRREAAYRAWAEADPTDGDPARAFAGYAAAETLAQREARTHAFGTGVGAGLLGAGAAAAGLAWLEDRPPEAGLALGAIGLSTVVRHAFGLRAATRHAADLRVASTGVASGLQAP